MEPKQFSIASLLPLNKTMGQMTMFSFILGYFVKIFFLKGGLKRTTGEF